MLVMRPAQMADLGEVQRLAADSPIGVTSLPDDVERLSDKIAASEASFAAEVSFNGEESYFFVLEDTETGKLAGCSAIVASAGYSEPFYSFRNETFVHASRELKIHNKIHVLSQCHDLTGNSLLTSFYVVPELVGSPWSELNSRGRLLFVASHPERFADSVVTEIVGYSDENGDSPFWDAIGRNFFDLNYAAAERLCGLKSRTFLAELMPHYPIYVPLLPDEAQEAMGQVHPRAQITFDILMREGFETDHYIDIFDGGPTLHARVSGIRSIAQSRVVPVKIGEMVKGVGRQYLVSNAQLQDYRAVMLELDYAPGKPVTLDLAAAEALGRSTGTGLTTLPANEERLTHRVGWAEKTFRGDAGRGDADYLFVLENDEGRVVGISAIAGAVGLREPWYNFRVGLTVSASQELNIYREIPTLFLANDLTGNSELCSLFLHADYRTGLNGRMLAKARLLFIAEFPHLFGNKIIAEMRGVSNDAGRSPFWESLGRHFFKMEFSQADYLTGVGNKAFIAELMPKFPLYSCFLSEDARNVIGKVHPDTEPALSMLKSEGFSYQGYVDIFDAGPAVECETTKIRAVRDSQSLVLAIGTPGDDATPFLIHNRKREECRITAAPARLAAGTLVVDPQTAKRLQLVVGDQVRAVPLSAARESK